MSIHIITEINVDILTKQAGDFLTKLCSHTDTPTLLLLSGGSAFQMLDQVSLVEASHLTIGMLDERYSSDALNNNFLQLQKTTFYRSAVASGARTIDTSPQVVRSIDDLVCVMDDAIRSWKREHENGKVYIVQGIGGDCHTAGIMPFPENEARFDELFENESVLVVGYDAKDKNPIPLRVTTTMTFLRTMVDESLVYIIGESKRIPLQAILSDSGTTYSTPGRVLNEMKSVTLFTDITI